MKRLLTTVLMVVGGLLTTLAQDKEVPLIQNVGTYEGTTIGGAWNYIVDVQEEGYYDYRMNPTRWGFFQCGAPGFFRG